MSVAQAQRLMDELFRQGYEVPPKGRFQYYYGMTFLDFKIGLRWGGQEATDTQILKWVKNYTKVKGKPPTQKSGHIGEDDSGNLSWGAIEQRLRVHYASSLSQFCVEHGFREAKVEVTDAQILRWAKNYIKKYGKPPTTTLGHIGEDDSGDLTWDGLDQRLKTQGSSLPLFLKKHGLRSAKVEAIDNQVLKWVKNYIKKHGKPPSTVSGLIGEADSGGLNWMALDSRLTVRGSSLSQFCVEHGFRDAPVEATDAQILNWVKNYIKKHGETPTRGSEYIGEVDSGNLSWAGLERRLRKQGTSFSHFCVEHRLRAAPIEATDTQIIRWVKKYLKLNGKCPVIFSGAIGEADSGDLSWMNVNGRLRYQGSSLFQFCVKHGLRSAKVEATDAQIINWVKSYIKKHGKPPLESLGLVGEVDSGDTTWIALAQRLRKQGSSLFQFCVKHGLRSGRTRPSSAGHC